MYSGDSKAYMLASISLYGTMSVSSDEENQKVIERINYRRKLVSEHDSGIIRQELIKAFGFNDPFELMEGE